MRRSPRSPGSGWVTRDLPRRPDRLYGAARAFPQRGGGHRDGHGHARAGRARPEEPGRPCRRAAADRRLGFRLGRCRRGGRVARRARAGLRDRGCSGPARPRRGDLRPGRGRSPSRCGPGAGGVHGRLRRARGGGRGGRGRRRDGGEVRGARAGEPGRVGQRGRPAGFLVARGARGRERARQRARSPGARGRGSARGSGWMPARSSASTGRSPAPARG